MKCLDEPSYSGSMFVLTKLAIDFLAPQRMTGMGADMVEYLCG